MWKHFLFSTFAICLVSCGNKSVIHESVKAEKLRPNHTIVVPLNDSTLENETLLPELPPLVGGIVRFMGDIFTKTTAMGKMEMSYTRPIPEIPTQYLKSVRLKRVFFYMKPPEKKRRIVEWYERFLLGKGSTTFGFLDKLAIKMTATKLPNPETYEPTLVKKVQDKKDVSSLMDVFYTSPPRIIDTEKAKEIVLLKYSKKTRQVDTNSHRFGPIHILETSKKNSKEIRRLLLEELSMAGLFKRILSFDNLILVELVKDPVANETFLKLLADNAEVIEQLGVDFIDTCTKESCLELSVPDVNLIPIAIKGNSLKFDAILHAGAVPETFKLKGFVEFEIDADLGI